ncbi:MAG TPA: hypothetical protein PKE63_12165, partial [Lacibacter sp.]|nr:hypothetical protein [Lacibacter sp.]
CSARQQRILADSWSCLKEDGLLIYSTCSYSREENEALLDWLAATFPVASCRLEVPAEWNITEVQSESGQWGYRFWPHRLQCEGFFIAAFRKQETATTPVLKSKTVALPTKREVAVAAPWLRHAAAMNWIWQGRQLAAVPARWWETIRLLQQQLQVRYAGVEVGTLVRDELLPDHPLALSVELRPDLPAVDLSREEALQYLRKQELSLATNGRGWTLARYAGYNLGWMKLLGNRINNYYPKEWRILK